MNNLLVIDTSQGTTSLAFSRDGVICAPFSVHAPHEQAAMLLHYIEEYRQHHGIAWQEVQGIGCITGIGGFTSVRIGVATARGLALALGIPAYGMPLLEVMGWWAWREHQQQKVTCVLPAGTRYSAWQAFESGVATQPMQVQEHKPLPAWEGAICTITQPHISPPPLGDGRSEEIYHFPIAQSAQWSLDKWLQVGTDGYPAPEPLYARPADAIAGAPLLKG